MSTPEPLAKPSELYEFSQGELAVLVYAVDLLLKEIETLKGNPTETTPHVGETARQRLMRRVETQVASSAPRLGVPRPAESDGTVPFQKGVNIVTALLLDLARR